MARSITYTIEDFKVVPWIDFWYAAVECEICFEITIVQQPRDVGYERAIPRILWPRGNEEMSKVIPEALRREVGEAQACSGVLPTLLP